MMSHLLDPLHWAGHLSPPKPLIPSFESPCLFPQGTKVWERSERVAWVRGLPMKLIPWFIYHTHPMATQELGPDPPALGHSVLHSSITDCSPPNQAPVWRVSDSSTFIMHSCSKPAFRIGDALWCHVHPSPFPLLGRMNLYVFTADTQTYTQHDRRSHSKTSKERKKEAGMRKPPAHKHLCPPITRIHHDQVCFGSAHYLASVTVTQRH